MEPVPSILRIVTRSGAVSVLAEPRDDIDVTGGRVEVDETTGTRVTTVTGGAERVVARVPEGTTVIVGTRSGSCDVTGSVGRTVINSRSGKVSIATATEADVRVTSSAVDIGDCAGECSVQCTSGDVRVASTGTADITTVAGRVQVGDADGDVRVRVVSGRVDIGLGAGHAADVESISGDVNLSVPSGAGVDLDVAGMVGRVTNRAAVGEDNRIRVRTVSGNVTVDSP